jgi:hypothetical protein
MKSPEQGILDTVGKLVALGGWTTPERLDELGNKAKSQIKKALSDERKKQSALRKCLEELGQQIAALGVNTKIE